MGIFNRLFGGNKKGTDSASGGTGFTATDALMDEDRFWSIIQLTKDEAGDEFDLQQDGLADELRKLTPDEIILFANRFRFFRGQANTWELWGAIYIIHGGCGDDSFNDFREWVIGQGRDFYYKTINDPETLVDVETEKIEDVDWEGLGYIPDEVFTELTKQKMPATFQENFEVLGTEWDEDGEDLETMFPKLSAKYNQ